MTLNESLSSVCHSNQHGHWFTIVSRSDGRVFTLPKLGTDTGSGQMLNVCSGPHGCAKDPLCRVCGGRVGGDSLKSSKLWETSAWTTGHTDFCQSCFMKHGECSALFAGGLQQRLWRLLYWQKWKCHFLLIFTMYELKEIISTDAKINKW